MKEKYDVILLEYDSLQDCILLRVEHQVLLKINLCKYMYYNEDC